MNFSLFKTKINESEQALVALQAEFDTLNTSFAASQEELANATQLAATLKEEFARVTAENETLAAEITQLKADVAEASREGLDVDELAARKAAEIIAEAGHEQVDIIEDAPEQIDIVSTFKGLKGAEMQAFYQTYRKEIAAALKGRK